MQNKQSDDEIFQKMIDALESYTDPDKRTDQAIINICEALKQIPFITQIIQNLNPSSQFELLRELTQYIQLEKYLPGQIIFKAGDKGDKFYIVLKGAVDIFKPKNSDEIKDYTLKNIVEQIPYENLIAKEQEEVCPTPNKVPQSLRKYSNSNRKNSLFHFPMDQIIDRDDEEQIFQDLHTKLATITSGGSFGELALTYNKPRFATVRVSFESNKVLRKARQQVFSFYDIVTMPITYLATLDKASYNQLNYFQKEQMNLKVNALMQVFPKTPQNTLMRIGYNLVQSIYSKNHIIYKQGDQTDSFYMLQEGEVQLFKQSEQDKFLKYIPNPLKIKAIQQHIGQKPIALLGKGSILGVQEIFDKETRQYTAICMSSRTILYQCMKIHFSDLLSNRNQLNELIDQEQKFLQSQQVQIKKQQQKYFKKKRLNYRNVIEQENSQSKSKTIHSMQNIEQGKDKISRMVNRNRFLQKNNKQFSFKIGFSNPFFKEQNNPKQLRKIRVEYERLKNKEKYNQNFQIKNFFEKAPLSARLSIAEPEDKILSADLQRSVTPIYSFKILSQNSSRPRTTARNSPTISMNATHRKQMQSLDKK